MNYDEILNDRIQNVKPSGIRKFFDILEEMTDAISLGIGEPDFVTPWHIRDAGIYSLERGHTKYTSNAGLLQLRREIAAYLNRRFKTVVGTSIWNYTIQKRIVNAQRSLYATGSISSAFQASGFSDYSTFYRNYNRIIGISPSDDLKNRKSDKERLLGIINPYC